MRDKKDIAIGEEIIVKGVYITAEDASESISGCYGCYFWCSLTQRDGFCTAENSYYCKKNNRTDGKNIIFKKSKKMIDNRLIEALCRSLLTIIVITTVVILGCVIDEIICKQFGGSHNFWIGALLVLVFAFFTLFHYNNKK